MSVRSHINEKAIYRVVNAVILTCMCLAGFGRFFGIAVLKTQHMLAALIVIAVSAGINFFKGRARVLCLSTVLICAGVAVSVVGLRSCGDFVQSYFHWAVGDGLAVENGLTVENSLAIEDGLLSEDWASGYEFVQAGILAFACYMAQILLEKIPVLKICLACVFFMGLLVCLFAEVVLEHLSVVFLIFYIAVIYVEWTQDRWRKTKRSGIREQMVWIAPFLALYLLLMAVMPAPDKPYDWLWARSIYGRLKESFQVITQNIMRGTREDFGPALSGFSGDGEVKEGYHEDDREIMTLSVLSQGSPVENLYLTGKVFGSFDGRQWLQESWEGSRERFIDTMEILYAVKRFDDEYPKDYLHDTRIKVRYEYFNTKYLFTPLKTSSVSSDESGFDYAFEDGAMVFPKHRGYGTEYEIRYYEMNLGQELFGQLLEAGQERDEAPGIANDYRKQTGEKLSLDSLEKYKRQIYERYLGEISVSEEVKSYLAAITEDAGTDIEKLRAIEMELASFQYTNMPGELPETVTDAGEFLDYFLLESRKGYCVHFATAFTLLARAEGFPARYVQGFCVPVQGSGETVVYSNMAHSWPEVYIDGVGWIPFEPTPGYGGLRYNSWNVKERGDTFSYVGNNSEEAGDEVGKSEEPQVESEESEEISDEEEELPKRLWRLFAIGIPAVLAGYGIVLVLYNAWGRYQYRRMSPEGRFREEVYRNLRILAWVGLERGEQETLQELSERGKSMPDVPPLCFIENYERIVYGGEKADDDMIEEAKREREMILELLKRKKSRMYLYYRLRLYLIKYY